MSDNSKSGIPARLRTMFRLSKTSCYAELWFEGHRYFDARRWTIAPEVFKAGVREGLNAIAKKDPSFREFNQRVKVDQPFMWNNKMYLLPINDSEIYSNPQLVQSPEY